MIHFEKDRYLDIFMDTTKHPQLYNNTMTYKISMCLLINRLVLEKTSRWINVGECLKHQQTVSTIILLKFTLKITTKVAAKRQTAIMTTRTTTTTTTQQQRQ